MSGKHSKELDCGGEFLNANRRELQPGESHSPFYVFDSVMCVHVYVCAHVSVSACVSRPGVFMCACTCLVCVYMCMCVCRICMFVHMARVPQLK